MRIEPSKSSKEVSASSHHTSWKMIPSKMPMIIEANHELELATACELAKNGIHVVLLCDNKEQGQIAKKQVDQAAGNSETEVIVADFHSQPSISTAIAQFLKLHSSDKVTLTPEQETMLITLYAKANESKLSDSLLHDHFAAEIIDQIDYNFSKLKVSFGLMVHLAVRAHMFDQWIQEFISLYPDAIVLNLGCGLDSRIFRIDPPKGIHWFDVDYPNVIELRQRLYPEHEEYTMIGSSVTASSWMDQLPVGRPAIIIAEGLFMYLQQEEMMKLLNAIITHFPNGNLAFDIFTQLGVQVLKYYPSIRATHAVLYGHAEDAHALEKQIPKLKLLTELSTYDLKNYDAQQFARMPWLMRLLFQMLDAVPALRRTNRILRYRF